MIEELKINIRVEDRKRGRKMVKGLGMDFECEDKLVEKGMKLGKIEEKEEGKRLRDKIDKVEKE